MRFKQPLIDLEVWERDLAVLECEVPEDSVPITWYLEDRRLQPGAKYGMEEWGTKRRLTIRDIGVDDDGIYLCEMPDGGRSIAEVAVKGKTERHHKRFFFSFLKMANIKRTCKLNNVINQENVVIHILCGKIRITKFLETPLI